MKILIAFALIFIFLMIAAVHFYWALGGKKWADLAIPTNAATSDFLFKPRPVETLAVGISFVGFAYIMACEVAFLSHQSTLIRYGAWLIPVVFLLRAVGEFRYVGFFKKINNTPFAQMDTKYYSPLCLAVGVLALIIKYI